MTAWRRPPSPAATSAAPSSSTSPTRARETLPLPDDVLRALHRRRRPRRLAHARARARRASTRSAPEAPLAFCFSPLVGTPLTTSAKFAVVAKSPLTGLLNDALASSHFAIAGKLTGHDAIVVRGACARAVGPARRRRRPAARAGRRPLGPVGRRGRGSACASGSARPGASPRSARRASACVRYATVSHDGRHAGRGGLGAVLGAKLLKAVAVRAGDEGRARPTRRRSSPRRATCARARSARRPRSTASSARSPTCSPSTRSRRCRPATSRPRRSPRRRALAAEDLAEARGVARDSCASCSIGCEHIYKGAGGKQAPRRVRERVRARPAVRRLRPRRRPRGQRPLRRARPRHDLRRRDDRLGDGVRRARPDRRAVAALRRRATRCCARSTRSARARASARCWPRARAPPREVVGQGSAAFAPHVKGLELPGLRAAHAAGDGARPRGQRARRRPQPLRRLRGRPVRPPRPPERRRGPRRGRDRDRGPRRGHGLADPVQVPARRVRRPVPGVGAAAEQRHRLGRRRRRARGDGPADRARQARVQRPRGLDARRRRAARALPRPSRSRSPPGAPPRSPASGSTR